MPFTPLHMGPGLAIKAVAGHRFSLLTFGIAQVVMDFEPLVGLVRGSPVLHGVTHTYLAALLIALIAAIVAPLLCRPSLRRWNHELSFCRLDWLGAPEAWSVAPVVAGALVGTLSHVAFDSFMHSDITPLAPWSSSNSLLGLLSVATLHQLCVGAGLFGVLGWLVRGWLWRRVARLS